MAQRWLPELMPRIAHDDGNLVAEHDRAVSRVERARILLGYWKDPSFFAVGQALGLHHQTVQRCVERAVVEGPMAALDDRPRPGREPTIKAI